MKYVSMRSIGIVGDMCSQIQQYASLTAVAKENDATIVLPEATKNDGFGIRLFNVLDVKHEFAPTEFFNEFKTYTLDMTKQVDTNVFNLRDGSYFIDGRFDLFKYWYPKYAKEILSWTLLPDIEHFATEYIQDMKRLYQVDTITSVHIRLGDYLSPIHHHFIKLWQTDYYNRAIDMIQGDNQLFLVFTNDENYCKQNIIDDANFVSTGNDYLDFGIMTKCDNNIIANSSYSLWGAFLNKNNNKTVVCPNEYLHGYSEFSHINGNYYPDKWVSISVGE